MMRKIQNLSQIGSVLLPRRECVITVKDGDESTDFIVTLRKLSYKEWRRIDTETPLAEPHVHINQVTGRRDYEMNHPLTRQRIEIRNGQVSLRRLAASIVEDFPSKKKTLEDKAEYLAEIFDEVTLSVLFAELENLHGESVGNVRRAYDFRGAGDNGAVGSKEVGEDPVRV